MDSRTKRLIPVVLLLVIMSIILLPSFRATGQESTADHFDVIIVLGNPATPEGLPGATMIQRVTKGVELYRQGVAPYMIFTGGAAANEFVESDVERKLAIDLGVPEDRIFTEGRSKNTYENAYYAVELMRQNNFKSAAIVSSSFHLKRARGIFSNYDIEFKTFGCGNASSFRQRAHDIIREHVLLCYHTIFGYPKEFMVNEGAEVPSEEDAEAKDNDF